MRLQVGIVPALLLARGASALPFEAGPRHSDAGNDSSVCKATGQWPGWKGIKYAFIFGDSYTSTGFNYTLSPPTAANPLGNPRYPGYTSANGPNWVDFLTTRYNVSALQTYNLAYGGATVDSDLVKPYLPTVLSVKQQVTGEFLPGYVGANATAPAAPHWTGADSLFAIWIGINDIGNSYYNGANETARLNRQILDVYAGLVVTLHAAGARNFAFINVPPVDRSPLVTGQGASAVALEKADIAAFNGLVADLAGSLKGNWTDTNAWYFDAHDVFTRVLDDPTVFPQTAGYKNTTAFCKAYNNGTPAPNSLDASCGLPVNQYFWLNSLHPTYPVHDVVAEKLSAALAEGPNVCPSTTGSTTR